VRRTFAFLDLTGFSALTESEGDQRAVAVLTVFRAALRDICSRRGVRIAKWLGDGAMLVCVETTPLVAAALEMQCAIDAAPEDITIKCGITTGPVILLEGDDYIGHAVNVASRLCDLARPHQVLAMSNIVGLMPPWACADTTERVRIKGLEQMIDVVSLQIRAPGLESQADPICRIPLNASTALERRHDGDGRTLFFCSSSCAEMWDQLLEKRDHDTGSVRELWMR
jgi:adenylate cyclase